MRRTRIDEHDARGKHNKHKKRKKDTENKESANKNQQGRCRETHTSVTAPYRARGTTRAGAVGSPVRHIKKAVLQKGAVPERDQVGQRPFSVPGNSAPLRTAMAEAEQTDTLVLSPPSFHRLLSLSDSLQKGESAEGNKEGGKRNTNRGSAPRSPRRQIQRLQSWASSCWRLVPQTLHADGEGR